MPVRLGPLITRTAQCLPATLAALPSTRAISDRDVFYVAATGVRDIEGSEPDWH
jgi:hypothetical protein